MCILGKFFLISVFACLTASQRPEITDIESLYQLAVSWGIEDKDTTVTYQITFLDNEGAVDPSYSSEITHAYVGGNVYVTSVFHGTERKDREQRVDRSTWFEGTALEWKEYGSILHRIFRVSRSIRPGASGSFGFWFSGFGGLQGDFVLSKMGCPEPDDYIHSVTNEGGGQLVTAGNLQVPIEQHYRTFLVDKNNQIKRVEHWAKRVGESTPRMIISGELFDWKEIEGRFRPSVLIVRGENSAGATKYEVIEQRSPVPSDQFVVPKFEGGDLVTDRRVGLSGKIGSKECKIGDYLYQTAIPYSGPPQTLEELLKGSTLVNPLNSDF